jgi:hypothetical protein
VNSKLILDANVATEFPLGTPEARAIMDWLQQRGRLATGGKNLEELIIITRIGRLVQELIRAGRAFTVDKGELLKCEKKVNVMPLRSDDPHVIALAILSGARILYSKDTDLIQDFKDKSLIKNPRGKCYLSAVKHAHLVR